MPMPQRNAVRVAALLLALSLPLEAFAMAGMACGQTAASACCTNCLVPPGESQSMGGSCANCAGLLPSHKAPSGSIEQALAVGSLIRLASLHVAPPLLPPPDAIS
jgi:hypothetical protein